MFAFVQQICSFIDLKCEAESHQRDEQMNEAEDDSDAVRRQERRMRKRKGGVQGWQPSRQVIFFCMTEAAAGFQTSNLSSLKPVFPLSILL